MLITFVLLILGAYALGSIPTAYLLAKWSRGIDLRQHGSGNVGASNLIQLASKRLGILVIIFDVGKGTGIVLAAQLAGLSASQQIIVGLAAIIGHNWPIFLHFSGGRGVLTTIGVVLAMAPKLIVLLAIFAFSWLPFGQLAVGSLIAIGSLPVFSWFSSAPVIDWLYGQPLSPTERLPVTISLLVVFLILITRRLTAPRTSLTSSVTPKQLMINRLLLDRDIRDREAWIHRDPSTGKRAKQ